MIIASSGQAILTFTEWAEKYRPVHNPYNKRLLDGKMFSVFDAEIDHVHRVLQMSRQSVWTCVKSDGLMNIVPGYRHEERLGYFITQVNWHDKDIVVTIGH